MFKDNIRVFADCERYRGVRIPRMYGGSVDLEFGVDGVVRLLCMGHAFRRVDYGHSAVCSDQNPSVLEPCGTIVQTDISLHVA